MTNNIKLIKQVAKELESMTREELEAFYLDRRVGELEEEESAPPRLRDGKPLC